MGFAYVLVIGAVLFLTSGLETELETGLESGLASGLESGLESGLAICLTAGLETGLAVVLVFLDLVGTSFSYFLCFEQCVPLLAFIPHISPCRTPFENLYGQTLEEEFSRISILSSSSYSLSSSFSSSFSSSSFSICFLFGF